MLLTPIYLLIIVAFLLVFPGTATGYDGSAAGESTINSPGSNVGGNVTWYQLGNINFSAASSGNFGGPIAGSVQGARSSLAYPRSALRNFRTRATSNNVRPNFQRLWQRATNQVIRRSCGSTGSHFSNPDNSCPLVWNIKRNTSQSDPTTWLNVHALSPNPSSTDAGAAGQIAGYNIRVWRENLSSGRNWDLVLQRQVGVGLSPSERGQTAARANRYWWYGGNTENRSGDSRPRGLQGGSFSLPGRDRRSLGAGMIGNGQGQYARNNCVNNVRSGINYRGSSQRSLIKRIRNGKTCYWEGRQMGPNPFSYQASGVGSIWGNIPRPGVPDNQFGPRTKRCYLGAACAGRRESLTFTWNVPGNNNRSNKPKTSFKFKLRGAPGLYYAVHVFALDTREGIVPLTRPNKYSFTTGRRDSNNRNSGQFFRVYITAPVRIPPTDEPYSTGEPSYSASLTGPEVLKTRQIGKYQTTLVDEEASEGDGLGEEASSDDTFVIPRQVDFQHFTPQLQYSAPQVASNSQAGPANSPGLAPSNQQLYSEKYVKYYNLNNISNHLQTIPAEWPRPPARGGLAPEPRRIALTRIASIDPADPLNGTSFWGTSISWLRPTLDNPCPPGAIAWPVNQQTGWPESPDKCRAANQPNSAVFNAWDDTLTSSAQWESQRVIRKINDFVPTNQKGRIVDQLLRCNAGNGRLLPLNSDQEPNEYNMLTNPQQPHGGTTNRSPARPGRQGAGYPEARDRYRRCQNTVFPLEAQATSGVETDDSTDDDRQRAQGIIDIRPAASGRDAQGPAFITLSTNRPGQVDQGAIRLVRRSTDPITRQARTGATIVNGNQIRLNFCQQWIPRRVNNNLVQYRNSGVSNVPAGWAGDPGCRGYVLRFQFETGRFTGSDRNKCLTNLNTAQRRRQSAFSNMAVTSAQGRYGVDDNNAGQGRAYGQNIGNNRAPFIGRLPWLVTNTNCSKVNNNGRVVQGHSIAGRWVIAQPAQRGWGRGNAGRGLTRGSYLVDIPYKNTVETGYTSSSTGSSSTGSRYPDLNIIGRECPALWGRSVSPETCWTLRATYQGFSNLIRVSMSRRSEAEQKFIQVYGDQGTR